MKAPITRSGEANDALLDDFSEVFVTAFTELYKGLNSCNSTETEEIFATMLSVFLYSIMRNYDKNSNFEVPSAFSFSLCDAAIKTGFARLQSKGADNKLCFTVPQRLRKMAEEELMLIINDWK